MLQPKSVQYVLIKYKEIEKKMRRSLKKKNTQKQTLSTSNDRITKYIHPKIINLCKRFGQFWKPIRNVHSFHISQMT